MGHFVNVNAYDDVIYLNTINYFYIIPLGYAPALLSKKNIAMNRNT